MKPEEHPSPNPSGTYTPGIIEDIQAKAELGRYRIRGFGTLRPRTWATFDDLTFIPCGPDPHSAGRLPRTVLHADSPRASVTRPSRSSWTSRS